MQLPAETVQVSFLAGQGTTNASFTGTRLLNVLDAAGHHATGHDAFDGSFELIASADFHGVFPSGTERIAAASQCL